MEQTFNSPQLCVWNWTHASWHFNLHLKYCQQHCSVKPSHRRKLRKNAVPLFCSYVLRDWHITDKGWEKILETCMICVPSQIEFHLRLFVRGVPTAYKLPPSISTGSNPSYIPHRARLWNFLRACSENWSFLASSKFSSQVMWSRNSFYLTL